LLLFHIRCHQRHPFTDTEERARGFSDRAELRSQKNAITISGAEDRFSVVTGMRRGELNAVRASSRRLPPSQPP
jgi:hypothetical protein